MFVERMGSLIDFLCVDENGFAAATTTPTKSVANECRSDAATVKVGMHGKSLEVSEAPGHSRNVIADDSIIDARNAESRTRCRVSGIEETVEIEAPEAIKSETVEVEHGVDIASSSSADDGVWSGFVGQVEEVMTEKVQPFVYREPVFEEHGLFRECQRWREHGAVPGVGDRDDGLIQRFWRRRSTWGWTEQRQRRVAPPRADPHAVGESGDGVSASHGLGASLGPMASALRLPR